MDAGQWLFGGEKWGNIKMLNESYFRRVSIFFLNVSLIYNFVHEKTQAIKIKRCYISHE